jgi:hypothetical protein
MLARVKQAILAARGTILGVVLNNVDVKHDQNYGYYTGYYGYYQPQPRSKESRRAQSSGVAINTMRNGPSEPDEY